jgi:hypothetical protein
MAGTTAHEPHDALIYNVLESLTVALPATSDVEAELQRIARLLAAEEPRSSRRSPKHRRQPLAGAFDSPEGFVFGSDESKRH